MTSTEKENRKTGHEIIKPICILDYHKYMERVDFSDQYLSYFNILRKTRKWYKKVGYYLINCGLFNAFKI